MIWNIDTAHTITSFKIRHLGISNIRGNLSGVTGTIETDDAGKPVSVKASLPVNTISTGQPDRDKHLLAPDFLDGEQYPTMEFVSTNITPTADGFDIQGNLTIHGVTNTVTIATEVSSPITDPMSGKQKIGGEASVEISRKDFGLTWNAAIEAGGVMVGDKVSISLEVQAVQG